jgi:serine/threonine-protein kinase
VDSTDRSHSIKALFLEVAHLTDDGQARRHLEQRCSDPALVQRVLDLREASVTRQDSQLSSPWAAMLAQAGATELMPGDKLGAWTLMSELGAGGMGKVFLAERSDGHYEQRAAVKILRGFASEASLARLARERQILASFTHPNIARLIDGGTTPRGAPYLVMEYVQGLRIDFYVRTRRPAPEALFGLLIGVCQALAYAHQQLVVHNDIKPGNILVTPEGRAVLLDFGIARLQGDQADNSLADALTPHYASPEQRAGGFVGAASDIFSLGRVIEELLVELQVPRRDEWAAIVAKATQATPDDRYPSVQALLADLQRFLSHEPLAALPPRLAYRGRKLLRRRWPWVSAGAFGAMLTVAFTVGLVRERDRAVDAEAMARAEAARAQQAEARAVAEKHRAQAAEAEALQQRDLARAAQAEAGEARERAVSAQALAQAEADTTRQVSDFLVGLFQGADPSIAGRPDLPAAVLVDKGRDRVESDLRGQSALQASMKAVLAQVYENIGRPKDAAALYEQAAAIERARGETLREAAALSRLSVVLSNHFEYARAEAAARRSLTLRAPRVAADSLEMADSHNHLGLALVGLARYDEARAALQRALDIRRAKLGAESQEVAVGWHNLGHLAQRMGQPREAEQWYRKAAALKAKRLAENHPSTLNTLESLAVTLRDQQRLTDAETLYRDLLARRRAVHGEVSDKVKSALNELAVIVQDQGRAGDSIAIYRESLQLEERLAGKDSLSYAVGLNNLGSAYEDLGDRAAAEAAYRRSLAIRERRLPAGDLLIARAHHNLGRLLLRHGEAAAARPLLAQSAAVRSGRLPAAHREAVDSQLALAELELLDGDGASAAVRIESLAQREAGMAPLQRAAVARLRGLQQAARAQAALAHHDRAWQIVSEALPEPHPQRLRYLVELASAARAAGDASRAASLLAAVKPRLAALDAASPLRALAERLAASP